MTLPERHSALHMSWFSSLVRRIEGSKLVAFAAPVVLVVLLNSISQSIYARHDSTSTERYSISEASRRLLKNLPLHVRVEAFFSEDLPDSHLYDLKQARDFLEEYARIPGGNFQFTFFNPDADAYSRDRARLLGIEPIVAASVTEHGQNVRQVYAGLALHAGGKTAVLPRAFEINTLEYRLSRAIQRLMLPGSGQLAVLAREPAPDVKPDAIPGHELLLRELESEYGRPRFLSEQSSPNEVDTLFVLGLPAKRAEPWLTDFHRRGGNLILALNGFDVDFARNEARVQNPEDLQWLRELGIDFSPWMVLEPTSFLPISLATEDKRIVNRPYPPGIVIPSDRQAKHPLLTGDPLFLPFSSSFRPLAGGKWQVLATSSPDAWLHEVIRSSTHPDDMAALLAQFKGMKKQQAQLPLLALRDGRKHGGGSILVAGSGFFLSDFALENTRSGLNLILNTVDWMQGVESLTALRSRPIAIPEMPVVTDEQRSAIVWFSFGTPAAYVLILAAFFYVKRHSRIKRGLAHEHARSWA